MRSYVITRHWLQGPLLNCHVEIRFAADTPVYFAKTMGFTQPEITSERIKMIGDVIEWADGSTATEAEATAEQRLLGYAYEEITLTRAQLRSQLRQGIQQRYQLHYAPAFDKIALIDSRTDQQLQNYAAKVKAVLESRKATAVKKGRTDVAAKLAERIAACDKSPSEFKEALLRFHGENVRALVAIEADSGYRSDPDTHGVLALLGNVSGQSWEA